MKTFICTILATINFALAHSQTEKITALKGYLIVQCLDSTIRSGCNLKVKRNAYGEVFMNETTRCGDGVFYKNIAYMYFVY